MTGLNWFQARALAVREKRAVRRPAWTRWLLYRNRLFLTSLQSPVTGREVRRVATTVDFTDAEFLAKDWTDETWEGGSYPPCTAGPGTEVPPSDTGGASAWTMNLSCAGDGNGGGPQPPDLDPAVPTAPDDDPEFPWVFEALVLDDDGTPLDYTDNHLLLPDGGACWITPPSTCSLVVIAGRRQSSGQVTNAMGSRGNTSCAVWVCAAGDDLTGDPVAPFVYPAPEFGYFGTTDTDHYGTILVDGVHKHAPQLTHALILPGGVGTGLLSGGLNYTYGQIFSDFPYTPGATIKFRVEETAPTFATPTPAGKSTRFYELVLPPLCDTGD